MQQPPVADGETMKKNGDTTQGLSGETANCRVVNIGLDGFVECLDVGPKACPYAVPFGYAFLCRHPRLAARLEDTRIEEPAQGPEA